MATTPRSGHSRRGFLRLAAGMAGAWMLGAGRARAADAEPFVVPPTLMLHPREKDIAQLPRILAWLTDNDYRTILYADLARAVRGETPLPAKTALITIDDLGSHYIEPEFYTIADLIEESGHRASFGVVTRSTPQRSPHEWGVLRELSARGFEMNTHTSTHSVLSDLETMDEMREEIAGSAAMLADGLGAHPVSLIVPYGDVYTPERFRIFDQRIFDAALEAGLDFVVGIVQGRTIPPDMPAPYYVGRVGVGVDSFQTRWWLEHFQDA
ncbi:MAG: polysaccharide deacetylase family protein [Anaerolineae bacterium]|nr:polysaccharide deacetylase family protein [Anaerolineae bacterium]